MDWTNKTVTTAKTVSVVLLPALVAAIAPAQARLFALPFSSGVWARWQTRIASARALNP
jgi:hypothetical protein